MEFNDLTSSQIIYSEHHYDECFEYKDGSGRVPEGTAIGYMTISPKLKQEILYLFKEILGFRNFVYTLSKFIIKSIL